MTTLKKRFEKMGIHIPQILLPSQEKMEKWAVVACDQFSSEKEYWQETSKIVGDEPSTLNLILPECYLEDGDKKERINQINKTMSQYMDSDLFRKLPEGFVVVDRSTPYAQSRQGMIIAVDLEKYSFAANTKSLIRPTEGTVMDRLPPRIEIRKNAPLDLPHILLLINDENNSIIEKAFENSDDFETIYDFDLMQGGGHITGKLISDENHLERICSAFEKLAEKNDMLFAVGDGNHSLATAKEIWEDLKKKGASENHPARYALVEIENIYNPGILFEPIHRVLFNIDQEDFLNDLEKEKSVEKIQCSSKEEMLNILSRNEAKHLIGFLSENEYSCLIINEPDTRLTYEVIQPFIDKYRQENKEVLIDYIHGEKSLVDLSRKEKNLGLFMKPIEKSEFFQMIVDGGALPRKTFSIGEAEEKRYYIESRRISL